MESSQTIRRKQPHQKDVATMAGRRERLEAFLKDQPQDPFLLYSLALEDVSDGMESTAVDRLDIVLDADADYIPAYLQKGLILSRLERYEEARSALEKGIPIAQRAGDSHAAGEMQGALDALP